MRSPRLIVAAVSFAAVATFSSIAARAERVPVQQAKSAVSIIDIGGIGPSGPSAAFAINNGLVVGYAQTAGRNGLPNAVITNGGVLTDLGAGLYGNLAAAVNRGGIAVGRVFLPDQSQSSAVMFRAKREINLGALPGDVVSEATAINDSDVIVGTSTPASATYTSRAFVFENGRMRDISALSSLAGFAGSTARGINDAGTIVGSVGQKAFFGQTTSSYEIVGTTLTLFGTVHGFGFGASEATGVNASGVVVGYHSSFSFSANAPLHAYVYAKGTFTDYGTLYPAQPFASSAALAVNATGVAVGYSQQTGGAAPPEAAVFVNGTVTDLNSLLPKNSGWTLETANGIDDRGNIVGVGLHNAIQRGFILRTGALFGSP